MKRLGDILIDSGFLTAAELAEALSNQKESGKRLGEVIIDMGLMSEFDVLRAVSSQYNYPIIDLANVEVDPKATVMLDEKYCEENTILPIGFDDDKLVVAIDDPLNILIQDDLDAGARYFKLTASDRVLYIYVELDAAGRMEKMSFSESETFFADRDVTEYVNLK